MKTKYAYRKRSHVLKGGKFLGEGSFGCVIRPAISCDSEKNIKTGKKTKTAKSSVSKIIMDPSDGSVKSEIIISNILKKVDPKQKYFLTINKYCKLKKIPHARSNVTEVEYLNVKRTNYTKLESKSLDKKFCAIDLYMEPLNLIMPDGGFDLHEIAELATTYYGVSRIEEQKHITKLLKYKIKTAITLFDNLRECIENLLEGLFLMHKNRVVNRDIKCDNIMAKYNSKTKKTQVRYIDYGLSENLTDSYCKDTRNIILQGTFPFIPPELFIAYQINFNYNMLDVDDASILYKINKDINEHLKPNMIQLNLDTTQLDKIIREQYNIIKQQSLNNTILNKYFGIDDIFNGYLQKGDIFTLGITLYDFLTLGTKIINLNDPKNIQLNNLLKHMLDLQPSTRYNVRECLQHPYFAKTAKNNTKH